MFRRRGQHWRHRQQCAARLGMTAAAVLLARPAARSEDLSYGGPRPTTVLHTWWPGCSAAPAIHQHAVLPGSSCVAGTVPPEDCVRRTLLACTTPRCGACHGTTHGHHTSQARQHQPPCLQQWPLEVPGAGLCGTKGDIPVWRARQWRSVIVCNALARALARSRAITRLLVARRPVRCRQHELGRTQWHDWWGATMGARVV